MKCWLPQAKMTKIGSKESASAKGGVEVGKARKNLSQGESGGEVKGGTP